MPQYFADPAIQPTPGDRGKTTRRKSTRSVRGPEGWWIALMKEEEAAARQPEPPSPPPALGVIATAYLVTCDHPAGLNVHEYDVNAWWYGADQLETARRVALSLPSGRLQRKDTIRYIPAGKRKPRERTQWTEI